MTTLSIPPVGLGTKGIDDPGVIADAIDMGYRHLDTAQIYENEAVVGDGIDRSDVPRERITVATKVRIDRLASDSVRSAVEASLERLGLEAVDLCYIHRPHGAYDPSGTLAAFDELVAEGLVDNVGVSNVSMAGLDQAIAHLDTRLAAHQAEYHPYFRTPERIEHARDHDYQFVAYSPLAGGRILDDPTLQQVGMEHDASAAQAALAYVTGLDGVVAIAKSASIAHLRANLVAPSIELTHEQRQRIDDLERGQELFPE